jgi:adrenodoxin-NADP+ reductase
MQLLAKGSANDPKTSPKSWSLDFLLSPESLHWSPIHPYHLTHAKFSRNELDPSDPYNPTSKVTPKYLSSGKPAMVNISASVFFRSVGYKSLPLPGLEDLGIQFDTQRGIIANDGFGRARSLSGSGESQKLPDGSLITHVPGLYCAGWVKRGPTGVIASTMTDAFTTADTIIQDLTSHASSPGSLLHAPQDSTGLGWDGVKDEVERRGLRPTSWKDWQRIDAVERERGLQKGKVRDKFGRVDDMLQVL